MPFKSHRLGAKVSATLQNVWDYLGSESITLPANARTLLVNMNTELSASTAFKTKSYKIDLISGTQTIQLLLDQAGTPGLKQMNVSQYAGKQIIIRPSGIVSPSVEGQVIVGVGDVYVEK
jgi:hypothetical protein